MADPRTTGNDRSRFQGLVNQFVFGWLEDRTRAVESLDSLIAAYRWRVGEDTRQGRKSGEWETLVATLSELRVVLDRIAHECPMPDKEAVATWAKGRVNQGDLSPSEAQVCLAIMIHRFQKGPKEGRTEVEAIGARARVAIRT